MGHQKILICTVGLPRGGKTTWALTKKFPIVNPDAIRLAIYGQRYWQDGEKLVWAHAYVMVRSLFLAGHQRVILDATNTTRKRRDAWQSEHWGTDFKLISTPVAVCLARAIDEGDEEIKPIIEAMEKKFEALGDGEDHYPGD